MASNDNIVVRIVGDASGVQPAVEETEASLGGLDGVIATLRATMQGLAAQMAEGFAAGSAGAKQLAVGIEEAKAAAAGLGSSIGATALKIHESAEAVRTFQMRAKEFAELYVALFAGEAIVHGIEKVVGATTEWTQANLKLSQSLGISLERASGLHVTLNKLGIGTDQVTGASQRLVRQLKVHENAINDLGIQTRDANGHFRDTLDILVNSMERLSQYQAGVDRTAAAQKLFGRGAGDLTAMLRLTNEQIEEGARVAHELGLVTTTEGVQAMRNYEDSAREAKEVFEALKIALGNALLPVLTDLANWFRGNGKQAVETFVSAIRGEIDGIHLLILTVKESIAQLHLWGAEFSLLGGLVEIFIDRMVGEWNLLGKVLGEVPHWSQMKADWESGMAALDASTTAHMNHIVGEVDNARAALAGLQAQIAGLDRKPGKGQDALGNPFGFGQFTGKPEPIAGAGGDERLDDLKDPKNAKKGKSDKPSIVEQWRQDLADMLVDEKNWGADEAQLSLNFWQSKLALTKKGSKEELAVQREISREKLALFKEQQSDQLANIKQLEALQLDAAKTDIALQRMTLQEKLQAIAEAEKRGQISAAKAIELRNEVNRQLYALDAEEADKEYQLHLQALQNELKLEHLKPQARKEIDRQIELLEKQHLDRMALLNRQYTAKVKADTDTLRDHQIADIHQITGAYTQSFARLLTLQQGFMTTAQQLWQSLQQTVAGVLDKILQQFIITEATKIGLIKTTGQTTVASEAAKAGAGGVASMAAAPFPIDLSAPAFGASMASAAASFGSIAAFDVGAWNLSEDQLAVVHSGEMIIPPNMAGGVRNMLQMASGSNGAAAAGRSGGDVHLHSSPTFNGNIASWQDMVDKHERDMMRWLDRKMRNGAFKSRID